MQTNIRTVLRTSDPEKAVEAILPGHRIYIGNGAAEPTVLVRFLAQRGHELKDVEIVQLLSITENPLCAPSSTFRYNSLFTSPCARELIASGSGEYTPCFFWRMPSLFTEGTLPLDAALISVSPPDPQGRVSLGVSVDCGLHAARSAKTVIAEINPNMPHTGSESMLNLSEIDFLVENESPLGCFDTSGRAGPLELSIAEKTAGLIHDGDCLQIGIGAVPESVLTMLANMKDLGIHSELISDGVMNLVEKGAVNGSRKQIDVGKVIFTFAMGSPDLYRWLHNNPGAEGRSVDYTNDPWIIGQNDNVVSINSALNVDLLGQVCAEAIGARQYSGVGGQVDFVRGAIRSRGGRSIITLPSTAKGKSRIVAALEPGQPVTTSRNDVDYVVTEYGVASLRGKTVQSRARELVNIADPRFREDLCMEFRNIYGLRI